MGSGAQHGHSAQSEQAGRGYGLLVAATPPGRHPAVDATEALPALAATTPSVLLGTATGSVVQLTDPGDPNTVLAQLRTAAAHDGPLLVYLAGQLMLDAREQRPHLALSRSTPRSVRYTGLPWHWLAAELGRRPAGPAAVIADLVADEAMWRERARHPLWESGLLLYGVLSAPPARRGMRAPDYSRALAGVLRACRVRPPLDELHQLVLHSAGFTAGAHGSQERMLLGGAGGPAPSPWGAQGHPVPPGTGWSGHAGAGVPAAPPVPPAPPAPAVPAPGDPARAGTGSAAGPVAASGAGAHSASDTWPPARPDPAPEPVPVPPQPAGAPPAAPRQTSVPASPAGPAAGANPPAAPAAGPVAYGSQPAPGSAGSADVPAGVHDAIYGAAREGHHGEAATMAAQWETAALRAWGPHSRQAVHWVEVRADLAHHAGEFARACTLWLQAASVRLQSGQTPEEADVFGAVDRAHHCWHLVTDPEQARPLGVRLAELRERAPGNRPGAVRDVRSRLASMTGGHGHGERQAAG